MRHKGSYSDIGRECAEQLMKSYKKAIRDTFDEEGTPLVHDQLIDRAINTPTERFYVSDMRAYQVVSAVRRGEPLLQNMIPQRAEMYEEILRRTEELLANSPDRPLYEIVAEIVEMPAPKFYLTHGSAKVIIHKEKKKDGK